MLLSKVEKFSKVSGLEINRTKSECLLLDFEMNLGNHDDTICGIPVVDNLKILGHFFGKDKKICDFQNFYSKIPKLEKITNHLEAKGTFTDGEEFVSKFLNEFTVYFSRSNRNPPTRFH